MTKTQLNVKGAVMPKAFSQELREDKDVQPLL